MLRKNAVNTAVLRWESKDSEIGAEAKAEAEAEAVGRDGSMRSAMACRADSSI